MDTNYNIKGRRTVPSFVHREVGRHFRQVDLLLAVLFELQDLVAEIPRIYLVA